MALSNLSKRSEALQKALSNMEVALELLDETDAPADIGAHLDLATEPVARICGKYGTPAQCTARRRGGGWRVMSDAAERRS